MSFTIRGYTCTQSGTTFTVTPANKDASAYQSPPTVAELEERGEVTLTAYTLSYYRCENMRHLPTVPSGVTKLNCGLCHELESTQSALPDSITNMEQAFMRCRSLKKAPIMSANTTTMKKCFLYCYNLEVPANIRIHVRDIAECYSGCRKLSGSIIVRTDLINTYGKRAEFLKDTRYGILLRGDSDYLNELAETANNNNAYVWASPGTYSWQGTVTDRTATSRTNYLDMRRIAKNISSLGGYPITVSYSANDMVNYPQWTQLIHYTNQMADELGVQRVTHSTSYINLNKMETIHQLYHDQSE